MEQLRLFEVDDDMTQITEEEARHLEVQYLQEELEKAHEEYTHLESMAHEVAGTMSELISQCKIQDTLISQALFVGNKLTEKVEWMRGAINHLLFTHVLKDNEWHYVFPDGVEWGFEGASDDQDE